jgi:gamma-glutamylcyclotransferase (GGCT)/AIG2-like uncharacterized protein YtfP
MPHETTSRGAQPARHVFVYGTLRRGGSNDITRLKPAPVWVGGACLRGALYSLGPYPGMRLDGHDEQDPPVIGEVYAVTPALERQLDLIEGLAPDRPATDEDEYAKRDVVVQVEGRPLACFMYVIHRRYAAPQARLLHGDWFRAAPPP